MKIHLIVRLIFTLLLIGLPLSIYAENSSDPLDSFSVFTPSGWEKMQDFYGVPVMMLGPVQGQGRPVVTILQVSKGELKFDSAALNATYLDYKKGRLKWLDERGGHDAVFFPFKTSKENSGIEIYQAGYMYSLYETQFVEKSYYLVCPKTVYKAKILLSKTQEIQHQQAAEQIIKSLKCKN